LKKLLTGFHIIGISKLYSYNINEDIIKWIKACLENRVQRVRINNCFSNWANVVSGIPQESILGPLLFIIYSNELPNICDSQLFLYADDAKVYRQIFNSQDKENLQHDLIKLNSWADNWLIKLNISKCKKVSIGRYTENIEHYSINNVELENVDSIKNLGVLFDSHIKFALHISVCLFVSLFVCFLLNGTSALFRQLVPRIVEIEHTNHVKNDLK